ncbi:Retrotransposon gag protein [Corchorus olitorius]|uniref:Retrotransposon gag protein n=1 Tax=Corchorus olitorius TaxID=93759 RepID=A0A1R3I5P8_9ROSI|nr:Retrotransposon gag protein [Corchorus olitorius]
MAKKKANVGGENTSLQPENTNNTLPPENTQVAVLTALLQRKDPPHKEPSKAKNSSKNPERNHLSSSSDGSDADSSTPVEARPTSKKLPQKPPPKTHDTHSKISPEDEQEAKLGLEARMEAMEKQMKDKALVDVDELRLLETSPFTEEIDRAQPPKGFRMPVIEAYDGTSDPFDHLELFRTNMLIQGADDPLISISSFKELGQSFLTHFISSRRAKKTSLGLMNIRHRPNESLRDYVMRFNAEALQVKDLEQSVAVAALMNGLRDDEFQLKFFLSKKTPKTLLELLLRAEKYINTEENMAVKIEKNDHRNDKKRGREVEADQGGKRFSKTGGYSGARSPERKYDNYTPLNAPRARILMQIERDPLLKWPKPMRQDAPRAKHKRCAFHRDHSHDTEDYRDLKNEIENLVRRGHLRRFVDNDQRQGCDGRNFQHRGRNGLERRNYNNQAGNGRAGNGQGARGQDQPDRERRGEIQNNPMAGIINVIIGGASTSAKKKVNPGAIIAIGSAAKRPKSWKDEPISFSTEDLEGIEFPHDDAIVISAVVYNHIVKRIYFDNGSASDVLYHSTMKSMNISEDRLKPYPAPLVGFGNEEVLVLGTISHLSLWGQSQKPSQLWWNSWWSRSPQHTT